MAKTSAGPMGGHTFHSTDSLSNDMIFYGVITDLEAMMDRRRERNAFVLALLLTAGVTAGPTPGMANTITNGRVTLDLDDPTTGFATRDNDRVDSVSWINSAGISTGNLASNAVHGPFGCGDPVEFFGQADGYPVQQDAPIMVTAGEASRYHSPAALDVRTHTKKDTCRGQGPLSALTTTRYTLSANADKISSVKIVRDFLFGPTTPVFSQSGLRPYMPRLPLATYHYVKLPDSEGKITKYNVDSCADDCTITDWNGTWLADDDGNGNGVVIVRSAMSTNPAFIVLDNDDYSSSNVSSVVLTQPAGGWKAPVEEIEYLCFYDATSWPIHKQKAGKLPVGCDVK
jgi:hypothetical protein